MRDAGSRATLFAGLACFLCVAAVPALAQVKLDEQGADSKKAKTEAIARAKGELSRVLEVPAASIALVSAKPAKWPDASLGCPEEGKMYAQVVTRGWAVVLKAAGKDHEVRVSRKGAKLCPPPK